MKKLLEILACFLLGGLVIGWFFAPISIVPVLDYFHIISFQTGMIVWFCSIGIVKIFELMFEKEMK